MPGSTDGSAKAMGLLTVGGLVAVTAYTVALGSNGWLWFGWGEREFYLNTPTWRDLSPRIAAHAVIGSDRTLIHVDHLLYPWEDARPVRLSPAEYRRLSAAIGASFDPADTRPIRGYGPADVFYPARGRYDLVRTCNWWTGRMLAAAGVRIGWWTPVSATVMQWFR